MPPQKLLAFYRGTTAANYAPRVANGAFWLDKSEQVPHLLEIQEEAYSLRTTSFMIEDDSKLESEVSHLGNMIARYSDAQVVDFDRRLKDAQDLGFAYQNAVRGGASQRKLDALYLKAVDANLAISYESRHYLQETLSKISHYGKPMTVHIEDDMGIEERFRGPFNDALRNASTVYPSSWNQALDDKLSLIYRGSHQDSWYMPDFNEVAISDVKGNFVAYSSLEKAREAKINNEFLYETHVEMVHELGHKFETVQPDIVRASRSFLRRRGFGGKNINLQSNEVVQDHFTWDYVGQLYKSPHTEVFSVGMESVMRGTQGGAIGLALPGWDGGDHIRHYRPDPEHRNLILGLLGSMHMPFNNDNRGKPVQTMFGVKVQPITIR